MAIGLVESDLGLRLPTRRKARLGEWDLDAEVCVHEHERDRLEQLCRYLLRPPLALDRLRTLDDGRICIALVGASRKGADPWIAGR